MESMKEFDDSLDEQAGTKPKRKTPEEMRQNPMMVLDPEIEADQEKRKHQMELDYTWGVAGGQPNQNNEWGIHNNGDKSTPKAEAKLPASVSSLPPKKEE